VAFFILNCTFGHLLFALCPCAQVPKSRLTPLAIPPMIATTVGVAGRAMADAGRSRG